MKRWWGKRGVRPKMETMTEIFDASITEEKIDRLEELQTDIASLDERVTLAMEQMMSELSAIRYDLEKSAPVLSDVFPSIDEPRTPDEEYATYLRNLVIDNNVSKANGEALDVRIIGQLQDDSYAWVNEERRVCGVVTRDSFGDDIPMPDDTFRARIVSYPWGHVVQNVFPRSLRSPFETRKSQTPTADWGREKADAMLRSKPEWIRTLRPGDVVIARIPYDGPMPVDRLGRKGKERPSVFMRWEDEYAILRACYDVKSFVGEKRLGHRSKASSCFSKPSVIRFAEFDTKIENLRKKLGRLGPQDLMSLHIPEVETPVLPPKSVDSIRVAPTGSAIAVANSLVTPAEPISKEVVAEILKTVEAVASHRAKSNIPREMAVTLLDVLIERDESRDLLLRSGLTFAVLGQSLQNIAKSRGTEIPKGTFGNTMREVVGIFAPANGWRPYIEHDSHEHKVLRCSKVDQTAHPMTSPTAPRPLDQTSESNEPVHARFVLGAKYSEPDLIVIDQSSLIHILEGRSVDFRAELNSLRYGGKARGVIVGTDLEQPRARLIEPARDRGWEFESTDSSTRLKVIERLVRDSGARVVTLITRDTEIIADLEDNVKNVNVVCEVEEPDVD